MAAGYERLRVLSETEPATGLSRRFSARDGMRDNIQKLGRYPVNRVGGMLCMFFTEGPVSAPILPK